jgi:hypothetical protein
MSYGDKDGGDLYYGDLLVDFFDQDNNMVNPPSDAGWFLYNLFGKALDSSMEAINQMLLNTDPITCEPQYLEIIAQEFRVKRDPDWNDEYWRAVIISYYYNLETIAGIEFVLNQISRYYNRDLQIELFPIVVEDDRSNFSISDKFVSLSACGDKFEERDIFTENELYINLTNNPHNNLIDELLKILQNGVERT